MPDFVYIPVPAEWAPAIFRRLAELEEQSAPMSAAEAARGVEPKKLDAALIERMYRESRPAHRRLLAFLAKHPGRWFYTSEIAESLDALNGARGVAGMLGAFGKRSNHRYGGMKPWETEWDESREEARHRMEPSHAEIINTVAAALADSR